MESELWKASTEGNVEAFRELLAGAALVDIEAKDASGSTLLIEAAKSGHIQIVSALLEKGADVHYATADGTAVQQASDPAIIELLNASHQFKQEEAHGAPNNHPGFENVYGPGGEQANQQPYYPGYPYYPPHGAPMHEGGMYYPPPPPPPMHAPPNGEGMPVGPGHLPPREVAQFIPCRFFPACRYGPSCIFLHPAPNGYYPPPMMPYDAPYPPNYYPAPPPSFQPNGVPTNPMASPPSHTSPASAGPAFSPNSGVPQPLPYVPMPPNGYPQPPHPGMQMMPPPQSPPQANYPPPPQGYPMQPNGYYPPPPSQPPVAPATFDTNGPKSSLPQDGSAPNGHARENGHQRRGSARRPSFAARKPPCVFFPVGRCKNGDDCRFPHVLPENGAPLPANGGPFGARGPPRPRAMHTMNGYSPSIDEKLAGMSLRDESGPARFKYGPGFKNNGPLQNKRFSQPVPRQRVPNADEFPVLPGMATPPRSSVNGSPHINGHGTPTAAQVLQAPARPRQEESSSSSASEATPSESIPAVTTPLAASTSTASTKLPLSFAAMAAAPDAVKEVQVSA